MISQELKEKIRSHYPDFKQLLQLMEQDHPALDVYLRDSAQSGILNKRILNAKSLDELKDIARRQQEGRELWFQYGIESANFKQHGTTSKKTL